MFVSDVPFLIVANDRISSAGEEVITIKVILILNFSEIIVVCIFKLRKTEARILK